MEKVLWIVSAIKAAGAANDGLKTVNDYLEKGWTVKHLSACAMGTSPAGQAYVVIEKRDAD
ncbi:MAG: hypothetical protein LBK56_10250 [Gracilibacteraceae bacterium]|jgi:hypothetical protein|nr:hypothetical protein [Gracilibacteraceae bacterium]